MKRTKGLLAAISGLREFRSSLGMSDTAFDSLAGMFSEYIAESGCEDGELTRDIAEGWLKWEAGRGRKGLRGKCSLMRSLASYINAMGGHAYRIPDRRVPPRNRFTPHIYSDSELTRLFAAIDRYDDSAHCGVPGTYSVLFRLLYTCGLRPGEGFLLLMRDIDFETGTIRIVGTKMHKERTVVMSGDMLGLMRRYRVQRLALGHEDGPAFIRGDGRPLYRGTVRKDILRCWKEANPDVPQEDLPRVRVYDFRHRFATANLLLWQSRGLDTYALLPRLRLYMGHEQIANTLYYMHLIPADMSAKVDCLSKLETLIPEVSREDD